MAKKTLNVIDIVKETILKQNLINSSQHLLLMVSGGSDSIALCYIIKEIFGNNFSIFHLNHNLRSDAKKDQIFVNNFANFLNISCYLYSENINELANKQRLNIEACGHNIRYELANDTIQIISKKLNVSASKINICTAHNADDRIENFYMRSIVGTGPGGFASMKYKNGNIIRPLLDVSKEMLIDYIKTYENAYTDNKGRKWHEDTTNNDINYFRAYIRHKIVPLAKKQNPKLINNLCNSMNLISDENDYLETQVEKILNNHFSFTNKSFVINPEFSGVHIVLKRRAIYNALIKVFKQGSRIDTKSITSIIDAVNINNYTNNIQQNYSVHSNKFGVCVQPMKDYRKSRNRL